MLLGDIYFEASKVQEGLKKIEKSSRKDLPHHRHHVYWYSRASSYGHPLGSFYTAMVYQFGFGVPKNLYRASRYVYVIFLPLFIIFSTIIYECHSLSIEVITKINYNYCHFTYTLVNIYLYILLFSFTLNNRFHQRYYQIALQQAEINTATTTTTTTRKSQFQSLSIFSLFYLLPGNSINDIHYTQSSLFWSFVKFLNWLVVNDNEYKTAKEL